MAVNVYYLAETPSNYLDTLQSMLEPQYTLKTMDSREALQEVLRDQPWAVVILEPQQAESIEPTVVQLKSALSSTTVVALVPESMAGSLDNGAMPNAELQFLPLDRPSKKVELLNRVASAIRLSEVLHQSDTSSQRDEVTALYNRRHFIGRLNEEISLARRHLSPLAVTVLGIDFFHGYVDSYGYEVTTQMVRHIASIVEKHVRTEDVVARIADDEISVLLPRSSEKGAYTLIKRILQALEANPFQANNVSEDIVVHAGVCSFPMPDDTVVDPDSLIRYARHALHNAKCNPDPDPNNIQLFSEIRPVF